MSIPMFSGDIFTFSTRYLKFFASALAWLLFEARLRIRAIRSRAHRLFEHSRYTGPGSEQHVSRNIRVRIPRKLDVVAFQSWNLDVVVFQPWNLDVVAFCPLKKCHGITMSRVNCLRFSMSWFFGLGISMSWFMCLHGLFSFSLNLLCYKINVNM